MTADHNARRVSEAFAKLHAADIRAGKVRSLTAYQALFPGHEAEIAAQFAAAVHERDTIQAAWTAPAPSPEPDRTPEWIGKYRVLDVLGEGGMGTVYLAEQHEPVRRRVALKVIKLGMDSKQVLARFEAERQALAVMNHDSIARVFDAGTTERGQSFFVMEHVEGVPLTDYCDRHDLTVTERIELFQQVCAGVQHAHQKGVIHRDLKPSNVLVTRHGETAVPKIIDFGLARATDQQLVEQTLFTEHGQMLGTPEYMSPEQAGLDAQGIDTRTDVYSLGVMLYELLVGELPFSSAELRTAGLLEAQRKIREDQPQKPSTRLATRVAAASTHAARRRSSVQALTRQLRGDLDWVVLKAMAKEPERRYESANGLAADLGRFLAHQPVLAGPPSTAYRLRKFVRRYRLQVTAGLALIVTLVAGGIGTVWFALDAKAQAEDARQQGMLATEAKEAADRSRDEAKRERAAAEVARRAASAEANLLKAERELANDHPWRALAYGIASLRFRVTPAAADLVWPIRHRTDHVTWTSPAMASGPAAHGVSWQTAACFSPDGRRIVTTTHDAVREWDATDFALLREFVREDLHSLVFTPRGLRAVTSWDGIEVWDATSQDQPRKLHGAMTYYYDQAAVACSPDGTRVAAVDHYQFPRLNALRVWNAATGGELPGLDAATLAGEPNARCDALAYDPSGRYLVAAFHRQVRVLDAASLQLRWATPVAGIHPESIAFSADGTRVAAGGQDDLYVWSLADGTSIRHVHGATGHAVAIDTAGRHLVAGDLDGNLRRWNVETGEEGARLVWHRAAIASLCFAPDDSRLVSSDRDARFQVWTWPSGEPRRTTAGHASRVAAVAVTPDGGKIVSFSANGCARTWDRLTGRELRSVRLPTPPMWSWCSPDGGRVVSLRHDGRVVVAAVHDAADGHEIARLEGDPAIVTLAFDTDGRHLVSGAATGELRRWNADDGRELWRVAAHRRRIATVAVSRDGRWIASVDEDGALQIRSTRDGALQRELQTGKPTDHLAFDRGGERVVATMADETDTCFLAAWEVASGQSIFTVALGRTYANAVAFSADGTRVICGLADQTTRTLDATTGGELARFERPRGAVVSVCVSDDGASVVYGCEDGAVSVREAPAATARVQRVAEAHSSYVTDLVFSPDGGRYASASSDQMVCIWDTDTGARLRSLEGHTASVEDLAWSPDGRRLATVAQDNTLRVWDSASGTLLHTCTHPEKVYAVAYGRGDRIAASGMFHGIYIWDAAAGTLQRRIPVDVNWESSLAFRSDGTRLVCGTWGTEQTMLVFDAATGTQLAKVPLTSPLRSVEYVADDTRIVAGLGDGAVRFFDAESMTEVQRVEGNRSDWVACSPDGALTAFARDDHVIVLVEVATGAVLREFSGLPRTVFCGALAHDRHRLVAGDFGGALRVWDADTGEALQDREGGVIVAVVATPDGRQLVTQSRSADRPSRIAHRVWDARTGALLADHDEEQARQLFTAASEHNLLTVPTPGGVLATDEARARMAFARQREHEQAGGEGLHADLDALLTEWERGIGLRVDLDTGELRPVPAAGSAFVGTPFEPHCR